LLQRQTRRRRLLDAAAVEAVDFGLNNMTRRGVAARAGVAAGSVNHEFETMDGLRDALIRNAIETRNVAVLAQGVATGHPAAKDAPADLRAQAVSELI